MPAFDTVLQRLSLWPSVTTGYVALSSAAAPEQGMQPLSPTQMSACRQTGFVHSLAEGSTTSPIQKSPWSTKQADGCLALTDSCCAGFWLLKISIFILSCSCCVSLLLACNVAKASVFHSCFFLMLSSVSLLLHCIRMNWDLFCLFKSHFYKKCLRN